MQERSSAVYQCNASNEYGYLLANAFVNVLGKKQILIFFSFLGCSVVSCYYTDCMLKPCLRSSVGMDLFPEPCKRQGYTYLVFCRIFLSLFLSKKDSCESWRKLGRNLALFFVYVNQANRSITNKAGFNILKLVCFSTLSLIVDVLDQLNR